MELAIYLRDDGPKLRILDLGGNLEFATMVFKLSVPQDAVGPVSRLTVLSRRGSCLEPGQSPFYLFIPEYARVLLNSFLQ